MSVRVNIHLRRQAEVCLFSGSRSHSIDIGDSVTVFLPKDCDRKAAFRLWDALRECCGQADPAASVDALAHAEVVA